MKYFLILLIAAIFSTKALSQSSEQAKIYYAQAVQALNKSDYTIATQNVKKAEELLKGSNAMTLAMHVQINFNIQNYNQAQKYLSSFFKHKAHPDLVDEMLDYAAKIDKIERDKLVQAARSEKLKKENGGAAYKTFFKEKALAENLNRDFAYYENGRYFFFNTKDKSYLKITLAINDDSKKNIENYLPWHWIEFSDFVRDNNSQYLKAKLRQSNYFTPGYDNGFVRTKPNRFYKSGNGENYFFVYETPLDVIVRSSSDVSEIQKVLGEWIVEDLYKNPFVDSERVIIEVGSYAILANTEKINMLAKNKSESNAGFYQIQFNPSKNIFIYPLSEVKMAYQGKVKTYMVSKEKKPDFRVKSYSSDGYTIGENQKFHHFKKISRRVSWAVLVKNLPEEKSDINISNFELQKTCWEATNLKSTSPSRNTGCVKMNPSLSTGETDIFSFFYNLSLYEDGTLVNDLFGTKLTIDIK